MELPSDIQYDYEHGATLYPAMDKDKASAINWMNAIDGWTFTPF